MGIFLFEKLSKRPREIVIVFRVTFVFPVQDHLYLRFISDSGNILVWKTLVVIVKYFPTRISVSVFSDVCGALHAIDDKLDKASTHTLL